MYFGTPIYPTCFKTTTVLVSNYRIAIDFFSDAYIVTDPYTSLMLDINQTTCAAFDYERPELLGLPVSDILPDLVRSTVHRIWSDLRYEETISIETCSRRRDGTESPVLIRIGRTNHDDRPAMHVLARDCTDDKRMIEMAVHLEKLTADVRELQEQNLELSRKHRTISEFLGILSHEMNAPLTSLIAFADILSTNKTGNLIPTQIRQLELMQKCGAQLNRSVSQLLDTVAIAAGTLTISIARIDIAEVVREAVELCVPALTGKNQTVEIHEADGPHMLEGDTDRLLQIMVNLIGNASKYSPPGSKITVLIQGIDDGVHVSVKDEGPGISVDDHRKIFEAFYRADNQLTRNETGTGLGLSIVKSLVEIHGGKISIDCPPGGGANIGFWLPREGPLPQNR